MTRDCPLSCRGCEYDEGHSFIVHNGDPSVYDTFFDFFFVFSCSKSYLCVDKRVKLNKNIDIMNHNEQEFEQVMRTHKATIYTVCYMFSKDHDEVADLFQECLINLWRSWPNFEGRSDVRTWIYRVSLNVCVSLDRKKRRHPTIPLTMDINPYGCNDFSPVATTC